MKKRFPSHTKINLDIMILHVRENRYILVVCIDSTSMQNYKKILTITTIVATLVRRTTTTFSLGFMLSEIRLSLNVIVYLGVSCLISHNSNADDRMLRVMLLLALVRTTVLANERRILVSY